MNPHRHPVDPRPGLARPARRRLLAGAAAWAGVAALASTVTAVRAATGTAHASTATPPARGGPLVEVWKDPNCGCCGDWVKHLEANGLRVKIHDTGNSAMRTRLGVAAKYGSCHTGFVGGYAIEGHVPAREVLRLLRERPDAIGLAVPGMPVGSPGMDGPAYGNRRDAYEVLLLTRDGGSRVFQAYAGVKA